MMNKIFYLLIFLSPLFCFGQRDLSTNSFISLDNENQLNIRNYQGYTTSLDSLFKNDTIFTQIKKNVGLFNGIRYYRTNFNEPTFFFNEMKLELKLKTKKRFGLIVNPSLLLNKNFSTFTYEFISDYKTDKFYFELSSERDLVGARALQNKLISTYYGFSMDYNPWKKVTVVGNIQYNHINDNNKRYFYGTRIIYEYNNNLFFDFRTKNMLGGEWSEFYFSPKTISQKQLGIGVNKSLSNNKFYFKGYLGSGLQKIDDQNMYLFSADIKLITKIFNKLNGESSFGIRNFNTYIYGFTNFKLKYTF